MDIQATKGQNARIPKQDTRKFELVDGNQPVKAKISTKYEYTSLFRKKWQIFSLPKCPATCGPLLQLRWWAIRPTFLRLRFAHSQTTAHQSNHMWALFETVAMQVRKQNLLCAIKGVNRCLLLAVGSHFYKGKSPEAASFTILWQLLEDKLELTKLLRALRPR